MTEETPIKEKAGSTSNEKLKELVEEFRVRAEHNRNVGQRHDANQIEHCADELEALINE